MRREEEEEEGVLTLDADGIGNVPHAVVAMEEARFAAYEEHVRVGLEGAAAAWGGGWGAGGRGRRRRRRRRCRGGSRGGGGCSFVFLLGIRGGGRFPFRGRRGVDGRGSHGVCLWSWVAVGGWVDAMMICCSFCLPFWGGKAGLPLDLGWGTRAPRPRARPPGAATCAPVGGWAWGWAWGGGGEGVGGLWEWLLLRWAAEGSQVITQSEGGRLAGPWPHKTHDTQQTRAREECIHHTRSLSLSLHLCVVSWAQSPLSALSSYFPTTPSPNNQV